MATDEYVIGVDFGTDSVRSLIVSAADGQEVATSVVNYPRWRDGKYCEPGKNQFRQHPLDYLESMETCICRSLKEVSEDVCNVIRGISVDTTGSTPAPMNAQGKILAELPEFADNPNAMFILWKDHTAITETDDINHAARNWGGEDFTRYEGGVYSSEWYWSKILHVLRNDTAVSAAAHTWIEMCDWVPAVLSGITDPAAICRSRCAAGHKAMWHGSWGGLPAEEFFTRVDPLLAGLRDRMYSETVTVDAKAGALSKEWAQRLGLEPGIAIGAGAFDAHMGAVGAGIEAHSMVKIIGTSTCDIVLTPADDLKDTVIKGICGQVDGSVVPGYIGLEAGQSGFGDVYAWFSDLLAWPVNHVIQDPKLAEEIQNAVLPELTRQAESLPLEETGILALDWLNGRRTPFADQRMKGVFMGLTLGTDAPRIFRSLVEATAFGARAINECYESQGVAIREIIAIGGISKKSDFVMQILADVLNRRIRVAGSDQACALGAAMCAAAAAGLYGSVEEAQKHMNSGYVKEFTPDAERTKMYDRLYGKYMELGKFTQTFLTREA